MASSQVEIMGQVRAMADVISTITVNNVLEIVAQGRIKLSRDDQEMLATIIRNSIDQGYSNAAGSLIRTVERLVK